MTHQQEQFETYANTLKENGFKVYVRAEEGTKPTHGFIVKNDNIGYIQSENYGGIRFSTVHKPCKQCGTGFGLNDYLESEVNPTVAHAEKTFILAPEWAKRKDVQAVIKYKNWDDFISSRYNQSFAFREF